MPMNAAEIQQARVEVIKEMTKTHQLYTNEDGVAAIGEIFDRTLGKFMKNNDLWKTNPKFKGFIMSIAGEIAEEAKDLACMWTRKRNDKLNPTVLPRDLHAVARAVMVRRHDECAEYLGPARKLDNDGRVIPRGILCADYLTMDLLAPEPAELPSEDREPAGVR